MDALLMDINWTATLVGTVVSFVLGWVWYSPKVFGESWAEGICIDISDNNGPMYKALLAQIVGTFLLAWTIAVAEALGSIQLVGLFVLTLIAIIKANGLFSQKTCYAIGVEAGFICAMAVVMIVAHGLL